MLARSTARTRIPVALLLLGLAAPGWSQTLPDKEEAHLNQGLPPPPGALDRSTPRRSWSALQESCRDKRWEVGAHLLNLGDVPLADRKVLGPVLARQLCEVLAVTGGGTGREIDDTSLGPLAEDKPRNVVVAFALNGPEGGEEAWLRRIRDQHTEATVWVLTRNSVSLIPTWYRRLVKKEAVGRGEVTVVNSGLGRPPAELNLTTPRHAAQALLQRTRQGDYAGAAHLLDLAALPPTQQAEEGARLARRLALVLRRLRPGELSTLSNDPAGAPEKDVPLDEEVVARTVVEGAEVQLRLARYPIKGATPIWLFSGATVAEIDGLYQHRGYGWAGDYLPPLFFQWQLWGIQLWQWLGLGLLVVVALFLGFIGSVITQRILLRLARFTKGQWDDLLIKSTRGPLVMALGVGGFLLLLPPLALASAPAALFLGLSKLVGILALGWFLVRIIDLVGELLLRYYRERDDSMGMAMVPVARKMLKPIVIVIVLIVALQNVGMNVGGLLAGLGIGGLALALAGKTTLENLLGSIIISIDRPFKIGDFIRTGDHLGTVEDLGLRSTRVRTLDRTLVTIPNAQMADARVENYTARDRMRLLAKLGVQYDTSLDQLRYIVDEIKRYLLAHPRVWQESFSVRFIGFGDFSLDIEVICYVTTPDWGEFTGIREGILMDLGAIIERSGAIFAYPSQTVYVGKDSPADAERAKEASATVATRRAAQELCLPDITEAVRQAVRPAAPD